MMFRRRIHSGAPIALLAITLVLFAGIQDVSAQGTVTLPYPQGTTPLPGGYTLRGGFGGYISTPLGNRPAYELSILDSKGNTIPNSQISLSGVTLRSQSEGVHFFDQADISAARQSGTLSRLSVNVDGREIIRAQPFNPYGDPVTTPGRPVVPPSGSGSPSGSSGGSSGSENAAGGLVSCGQGEKPCTLQELFGLGARIFNWLLATGGAVALLAIIWAGLKYILAVFQGGDSSAIAGAKQSMMYAIIGLVVLLGTFVIVRTVLTVFDVSPGRLPTPPPQEIRELFPSGGL